jgi:hypothetical protein
MALPRPARAAAPAPAHATVLAPAPATPAASVLSATSLSTFAAAPPDGEGDGPEDGDDPERPPAYARRDSVLSTSANAFVEHAYSLSNSTGRAWATLRLRSRARAPAHVPYIREGDTLSGVLELNIEKEDTIQQVDIEVRTHASAHRRGLTLPQAIGWVGSSATDAHTFVRAATVLWSIEHGSPHAPARTDTLSSAKLAGAFAWPFALALPAHVTVQSKKRGPTTYRLPASYHEKGAGAGRANVQYQLTANVRRGKFRVDSK